MTYCSQQDLENALGKPLVTAAYDDDGDGLPDETAIAACLQYADAECNSFLRGAYRTTYPIPDVDVPDELRFAAVDFACAYTARRRPEIAHTLGSDPFKQFYDAAVAKMKRFATYEQRLSTEVAPNEPLATVTTTAAKALLEEAVIVRVFDDMGSF